MSLLSPLATRAKSASSLFENKSLAFGIDELEAGLGVGTGLETGLTAAAGLGAGLDAGADLVAGAGAGLDAAGRVDAGREAGTDLVGLAEAPEEVLPAVDKEEFPPIPAPLTDIVRELLLPVTL